jgi:hypothetical protein
MDLDGFIEMLGLDVKSEKFRNKFKEEICGKCEEEMCEYISFQVAGDEYPTVELYCHDCLTGHDFEETVTSQVRPSDAFAIKISTGQSGDVSNFTRN